MDTLLCTKCKKILPEADFTVNRAHKRGRDYNCRSCVSIRKKAWMAAHSDYTKERDRAYRARRRDIYRKSAAKSRVKCRADLIAAYGGKCVCCGEWRDEFLTLDHIERPVGRTSKNRYFETGVTFYFKLRRRGFPSGYRILCWNCNCARGHKGYCPHERE